jgi:hypothetical protein
MMKGISHHKGYEIRKIDRTWHIEYVIDEFRTLRDAKAYIDNRIDYPRDTVTTADGQSVTYALKGFGLTRCLTVIDNVVVRYFIRPHRYDNGHVTDKVYSDAFTKEWAGPDRVMRDMIAHLGVETDL